LRAGPILGLLETLKQAQSVNYAAIFCPHFYVRLNYFIACGHERAFKPFVDCN